MTKRKIPGGKELFISLVLDAIGLIPMGPLDLAWGIIPKIWIDKTYDNNILEWFAYIEEALPFTDIIPTCTIAHLWDVYKRKK